MRLFIVEGDPHIAEMLFEGLGKTATSATTPPALSRVRRSRHCFLCGLLLDVRLPGGIGARYRLGQHLRQAGVGAPILDLTAWALVQSLAAACADGRPGTQNALAWARR